MIKVVVKKSLTKNNNISKSHKEPSIEIISSDINKRDLPQIHAPSDQVCK